MFLRFAGCNLKCAGWPCDTQHAIDPKLYRHEWKEVKSYQLFDMVMAELDKYDIRNVCLTGGEPFLQPDEELYSLVQLLRNERPIHVEAFTNGSLPWPTWTFWSMDFVMDWKLSGSREWISRDDILKNVFQLSSGDAIKFTVAHEGDLMEALKVWRDYHKDLPAVEFFAGPVWDLFSPDAVVKFILEHKLPWRLNIQTHKYIWPPEERGR